MEPKQNFHWLDLIRGISALAVFSGHLRVLCFKDYASKDLPVLGKLIFFVTGFGHEAVMIFFVMSGFFIIKSIQESHEKNRWSISSYSNNRLIRLWVVLIPALVVGFTLDKIGLNYFSESLAYSNKIRYFTTDLYTKLNYTVLAGNALFLQTIAVPTLGSNGSLWSLTNEFWYYAVFPLLYFAIVKRYSITSRILSGTLGLSILIILGQDITLFFIIWLMGGLSYFLTKTKYANTFNTPAFLSACGTFLTILLATRLKYLTNYFNDYTLALSFSALLPMLIGLKMENKALVSISKYLSNISYTLYLVHLPFNFLITSYFNFQNNVWTFNNLFIFLALICLTIMYATAMWYLFERNTPIIKRHILDILKKQITRPPVKITQ